jgi:hypothetical protein
MKYTEHKEQIKEKIRSTGGSSPRAHQVNKESRVVPVDDFE